MTQPLVITLTLSTAEIDELFRTYQVQVAADDIRNDPIKYIDYECQCDNAFTKYIQQDIVRQYARELIK